MKYLRSLAASTFLLTALVSSGIRGCPADAAYDSLDRGSLADESRTYITGIFRVRARRPQLVTQAAAGGLAWFPSLALYPTGQLLARINTWPDAVDAVSPIGLAKVSYDGGHSWTGGYTPPGLPSAGEPLAINGANLIGCEYAPFALNPDARNFKATKVTISNGGLTHATVAGGITISGLPRDVIQWPGHTQYAIAWFGDIVKIAGNNWVSVIQVNYSGDAFLTPAVIKSTDSGLTWNYLSQAVASPGAFNDGFSETALIQLLDSRLMLISRVQFGARLGRVYSSDNGVTWTAPDRLSPGTKAPRIIRLSNTNDYAILAGQATQPTPERWPSVGLYLSSDPTAVEWSSLDLITHHNAMMPAKYAYNRQDYDPNQLVGPGATGYTSIVETSPGHVVLLYDDGSAYYNINSNPARVYAVELFIDRAP